MSDTNPVSPGQAGENVQPISPQDWEDFGKDMALMFLGSHPKKSEELVKVRLAGNAAQDLAKDVAKVLTGNRYAAEVEVRAGLDKVGKGDIDKLAAILHCRPENFVADAQVLATILDKVATLTKVGTADLVNRQGLVLALLEDPTVAKLLASNADLRARQARDERKARRHAAVRNVWGFISKSFWVAKWAVPALLVALVVGLCVQPMGVANLFAWLWGQATMEQRVQGEVERFMLPTLRETWGEDIAPKTYTEAVRFVERYQGKPDELMTDALAASKRHVPVTTPASMSNLVSFPEIRPDQKSEELDLAAVQRCKDLSKAAPELVSSLAKQLEGKEHGIVARMLRVQLEGERPSVDLALRAVTYMSAVVDVLNKDIRHMRDSEVRAYVSATANAHKAVTYGTALRVLQQWLTMVADDTKVKFVIPSRGPVELTGAQLKQQLLPADSLLSDDSLQQRVVELLDMLQSAATDRLATMAATAKNRRVYDPWEKFLPDRALGPGREVPARDIIWRVWGEIPTEHLKAMLERQNRPDLATDVRKAFGR